MNQGKFYVVIFIVGVILPVIFLSFLAKFDLFGNGPFEYQSLAVFFVFYFIAGILLNYTSQNGSLRKGVSASLLFGLPMVALFYLIAFGDKSPFETVPRFVGIISPWVSTFIGWIIGDKFRNRISF
jgi:hypothetical protein